MSNSYVYANEILSTELRKLNSPLNCFFYTTGGISVHLFSTKWNYFADYIWVSVICIAICSLSFVILVELPFYLFTRGDARGLGRCLTRMCWWNFRPHERAKRLHQIRSILAKLPIDSVDSPNTKPLLENACNIQGQGGEQSTAQDSDKAEDTASALDDPSTLKVFCRKTNLIRFGLVLCNHSTQYMIFGLGVIFNKNLGIKNIYLCGILLTAPKLFSHLVMGLTVTRVRFRTINIWVNSLIAVFSGALLFMNLIHNARESYADRSEL